MYCHIIQIMHSLKAKELEDLYNSSNNDDIHSKEHILYNLNKSELGY